jgi:hypothetical protein
MWWSFGILIYFFPTIIALKKEGLAAIFLFNLFLGVTGLGWLLALLWGSMANDGDWYNGLRMSCKKCGQHYELPNESWFGQELICSQCDNYIRIPTPWFGWIADLSVPLVIFVWVFGTIVWHFTQTAATVYTSVPQ